MKRTIFYILGTLLLLCVAVFAAAYVTRDPYRVWFVSLLDHAFERTSCPDDWTFAVLAGKTGWPADPKQDVIMLAGQELLAKRFARAPNGLRRNRYDGGGGVDTLGLGKAGYVNLDGYQLTSIEIVNLQNEWPNIVHVLLSGLATAERRDVLVYGDREVDLVYLDGCLRWDYPEYLEAEAKLPNRYRMTAIDREGATGTVEIADELPVKLPHSSRVSTWAKIMH